MKELKHAPFALLSASRPLGVKKFHFFSLSLYWYMLFFWWVGGDPLGIWGLGSFSNQQIGICNVPVHTVSTRSLSPDLKVHNHLQRLQPDTLLITWMLMSPGVCGLSVDALDCKFCGQGPTPGGDSVKECCWVLPSQHVVETSQCLSRLRTHNTH